MSDLVVTVPRGLWAEWIEEGDAVGAPETGTEWGFYLGGRGPPIRPGERLYIVAHDRLRGFAPVTRVAFFVDGCPDHSVTEAMMAGAVGGQGYGCAWCDLWLDTADTGHAVRPPGVTGRWAIGRKGGAVAVTVPQQIQGFRGWRKPWWSRSEEVPFPDWKTADLWLNRARARIKRADEQAKKARSFAVEPAPQIDMFAD